ncbi:hypothetical protein CJ178_31435 [Rhodococcus sp. ACPA4]|nr:hypothetical protein CJ178_31435 [Rhodococcus sp. ACPA4]
MDIRSARIARNARTTYAQVEIFPHLQDPIYTQDPTHQSSNTALPDVHCSGTKTPPFVERSPFILTLHAADAMHAPDVKSGTRGAAKATSPASSIYTAKINQLELRNEAINRSLEPVDRPIRLNEKSWRTLIFESIDRFEQANPHGSHGGSIQRRLA